MPQAWGKVKIPADKKIAVNLGCDFDAQQESDYEPKKRESCSSDW
jgi:hypothetical protein